MAPARAESKFGLPLYCAGFPPGTHVLVAGGGGKASSGIPNRCAIGDGAWRDARIGRARARAGGARRRPRAPAGAHV